MMRIAVLRKKTIRSRRKVLRVRITGTKDATRLSEELQTNKMRLGPMREAVQGQRVYDGPESTDGLPAHG